MTSTGDDPAGKRPEKAGSRVPCRAVKLPESQNKVNTRHFASGANGIRTRDLLHAKS